MWNDSVLLTLVAYFSIVVVCTIAYHHVRKFIREFSHLDNPCDFIGKAAYCAIILIVCVAVCSMIFASRSLVFTYSGI